MEQMLTAFLYVFAWPVRTGTERPRQKRENDTTGVYALGDDDVYFVSIVPPHT